LQWDMLYYAAYYSSIVALRPAAVIILWRQAQQTAVKFMHIFTILQ
jgi:hypothetical protein